MLEITLTEDQMETMFLSCISETELAWFSRQLDIFHLFVFEPTTVIDMMIYFSCVAIYTHVVHIFHPSFFSF